MQLPDEQIIATPRLLELRKAEPAFVFTLSILITLLGIFVLDAWAETGGLQHAAQHALIFLGGLGTGTSLLASVKNRKEK